MFRQLIFNAYYLKVYLTRIPTYDDWQYCLVQYFCGMITRGKINKMNVVGLFLTAIFLFFFINSFYFQHIHILANGSIVKHAHPYNKGEQRTPNSQHKHNSVELCVIATSELLFADNVVSIEGQTSVGSTIVYLDIIKPLFDNNLKTSIGRSPPSLNS